MMIVTVARPDARANDLARPAGSSRHEIVEGDIATAPVIVAVTILSARCSPGRRATSSTRSASRRFVERVRGARATLGANTTASVVVVHGSTRPFSFDEFVEVEDLGLCGRDDRHRPRSASRRRAERCTSSSTRATSARFVERVRAALDVEGFDLLVAADRHRPRSGPGARPDGPLIVHLILDPDDAAHIRSTSSRHPAARLAVADDLGPLDLDAAIPRTVTGTVLRARLRRSRRRHHRSHIMSRSLPPTAPMIVSGRGSIERIDGIDLGDVLGDVGGGDGRGRGDEDDGDPVTATVYKALAALSTATAPSTSSSPRS